MLLILKESRKGKYLEIGVSFFLVLTSEVRKFIFYVGFLSGIFMIHRATGETGGSFLSSSLPFPLVLWTFRY